MMFRCLNVGADILTVKNAYNCHIVSEINWSCRKFFVILQSNSKGEVFEISFEVIYNILITKGLQLNIIGIAMFHMKHSCY